MLEVERELGRVREEIERFQGQLNRFDDQVAMSTVTLKISTRRVFAAGATPSLGERISRTLGGSWQVLVAAGHAVLLIAVALVPWLLPLLLVAFGIRALAKRWQRRQPIR